MTHKMTTRRLTFLTVALVACISASAWAGGKEEAKRLFDAGLNLMKAEDFAGAAANFERSVSLFPTQNSLFNLANCYRATHRYGEALDTLERLQRDFGKTLKPEIQAGAIRQQSEIRALAVRLTLEVSPADASVTVDGKAIGPGPTRGPLVLGPGEHTVEATRADYQVLRQTVQLVSGRDETVRLALVAEVKLPPAGTATQGIAAAPDRVDLTAVPAQPEEVAAQPIYKRWWFWTAAAAVAVGTGVALYAATSGGEAPGPEATLGTKEMF